MLELKKAQYALVFDVESVGLHGVDFAFGGVVVDLDLGTVVDEHCFYVEPKADWGTAEGFAWIEKFCMPSLRAREETALVRDRGIGTTPLRDMRSLFWHWWLEWQKRGAVLAADCSWPVEARFLAACVDDGWRAEIMLREAGQDPKALGVRSERHNDRYWQGPYPLIDIGTVLALVDVSDVQREEARGELPEHDPLADAKHSARQLYHALETLVGPIG